MPIIASAKKRMRQDKRKRVRNHATLMNMRTLIKNILKYIKEGKTDKIAKSFSETQSSIDTCVKKNLIHKNNGARKKAKIVKKLANLKGMPKIEKVNKKEVKPKKKITKKSK